MADAGERELMAKLLAAPGQVVMLLYERTSSAMHIHDSTLVCIAVGTSRDDCQQKIVAEMGKPFEDMLKDWCFTATYTVDEVAT